MAAAVEVLRFDSLDDLFVIPDLPVDLDIEDYEVAFDAGVRNINDENFPGDFYPSKDESRFFEPFGGYTAIDGHSPNPSEFLAQWPKSIFSGSNIPNRSGFSIVAAADPDPIPSMIEQARPTSTHEEIFAMWERNLNIKTTHEQILNGYLALKNLMHRVRMSMLQHSGMGRYWQTVLTYLEVKRFQIVFMLCKLMLIYILKVFHL